MEKCLYHQYRNSEDVVFTVYTYDYNSPPFNVAHFHKNYEILVAMRGGFECFIGNQKFVLSEGEAILFLPFQIHGLYVPDGSCVWCSTFAERYIKTLASYLAGKKAQNPVFRPDRTVAEFFFTRLSRGLGPRGEWIKSLTKTQELTVKSCLYAMGSEYLEQVELIPAKSVADTVAVDVVQYISENFRNDISLHDVAEQRGYNYQYLSRTFNKTFGINFKKMLNQCRMEYALSLLQETEMPIAQIAFESGFQSIRSFDHVAHATFGKSPKELRQEQSST